MSDLKTRWKWVESTLGMEVSSASNCQHCREKLHSVRTWRTRECSALSSSKTSQSIQQYTKKCVVSHKPASVTLITSYFSLSTLFDTFLGVNKAALLCLTTATRIHRGIFSNPGSHARGNTRHFSDHGRGRSLHPPNPAPRHTLLHKNRTTRD